MIDLHLHTTCSDGLDSPESVVRRAVAAGLRAIAVTDHDTTCATERARRAVAEAGCGLVVVSGVELSAVEGTGPVHILGYGIDPAHPSLGRVLDGIRAGRRDRACLIVERLRATGLAIEMTAVEEAAGAAPITRAHIAAALVETRCVPTYAEAFARYLSHDPFAPAPQNGFRPTDAIEVVHEAGGVAVMAHPVLTRRDELIAGLVRHGLDGIETIHPTHTPASKRFYERLARKQGLIVTGGSDSHGQGRGADLLGALVAPETTLRELSRAIENRRPSRVNTPSGARVPSVS